MGADSKIEWTHHTFNPWWGCTRVSPGCEHCYAETFAKRVGVKWGPRAERRLFGSKHWAEPLKWNKLAELAGQRRRVFCASMADVFENRPELDAERLKLWDLIARTPSLDWLLLTKRPENAANMVPMTWSSGWPRNVWAMVTAEDQRRADERIPILLSLPAAVRGVSYEPALGPVDFTRLDVLPRLRANLAEFAEAQGRDGQEAIADYVGPAWQDALTGIWFDGWDSGRRTERLDWIIVGGESGPGARPFDLAWARSTVEQCKATGVPCFVKQLGAKPQCNGGAGWEVNGVVHPTYWPKLKDKKGGTRDEWPEDLRVREFPEAAHG